MQAPAKILSGSDEEVSNPASSNIVIFSSSDDEEEEEDESESEESNEFNKEREGMEKSKKRKLSFHTMKQMECV
ncbi:hypothetical protein DASC09_005080 [Saccharomycopsis crataegensis]|uniref:Uncharacterized protein n=1 Tax=Saccharomycopsis crataegensis TaxID=43959 RepID=A0AAV5QEB4_9ASCO|nr:hypothetical protein DASC09_005080 [Saccharomycopsis crataegensis]